MLRLPCASPCLIACALMLPVHDRFRVETPTNAGSSRVGAAHLPSKWASHQVSREGVRRKMKDPDPVSRCLSSMLAYAWVLFSTSLIWLSFYVKLICQTQKLFKLCVYTLLFLKKSYWFAPQWSASLCAKVCCSRRWREVSHWHGTPMEAAKQRQGHSSST